MKVLKYIQSKICNRNNNDFGPLTMDELKRTADGIFYRFMQIHEYINLRPRIFNIINNEDSLLDSRKKEILDYIQNTCIESFIINYRCQLEYFNPKNKYKDSKKWLTDTINAVQFFPNRDCIEYKHLKQSWDNNFMQNSWKVRYLEGKQNQFSINYNELIHNINAHLPHPGRWKIKTIYKKQGMRTLKLDWPIDDLYKNMNDLMNTWFVNVKSVNRESVNTDYCKIMSKYFWNIT